MSNKIKIKNARLSFPSLFNTEMYAGEDTGKYSATFVLDKAEHAQTIKEIEAQIAEMLKEMKAKLPPDKIALKDGDQSGRDELVGKMTIKATTKKRPLVLNRDKTPLVEQDEVIYAGCYVNAIVNLWAQDNQYGKRINCSLSGVQFAKDGESFGEAVTADEFDDLSEFSSEDQPF